MKGIAFENDGFAVAVRCGIADHAAARVLWGERRRCPARHRDGLSGIRHRHGDGRRKPDGSRKPGGHRHRPDSGNRYIRRRAGDAARPRTAEEILGTVRAGDGFLRGRGRRVAGPAAPTTAPRRRAAGLTGATGTSCSSARTRSTTSGTTRCGLSGTTPKQAKPCASATRSRSITPTTRPITAAGDCWRLSTTTPTASWFPFIDPETLTVTETVTLPCRIYSLAYSPERDMYVAGIAGGQSFCLLDAAFRQVGGPYSAPRRTPRAI